MEAQPARLSVASPSMRAEVLRILNFLLRAGVPHQKGPQYQDHDADANRCIGDIEDQKGTPCAEVQIGEVENIAEAAPVDDIAERSAQHHAERDLVTALRFPE